MADNTTEESTGGVQRGDEVKVHYTGRLQDGTVFDSSKGKEPMAFRVGAGQMIQGFDAGVIGMTKGQTKTLTLPPASAYGEYDPQLVKKVPRPEGLSNARVGSKISAGAMRGIIIKLDADTVTADFNHELAGKTLIFDVELVELTKGNP